MFVYKSHEIPDKFFILNKIYFHTDIYLRSESEIKCIFEYIDKYGFDQYQKLFLDIGIKFDTIDNNGLSFILNGTRISICELSSGERLLLFSYVINALDKSIILIGLLDRLDFEHRQFIFRNIQHFPNLFVITMTTHFVSGEFYIKYKGADFLKDSEGRDFV